MIGDKRIIDISFVHKKNEFNSFCGIKHVAFEGDKSLSDMVFPAPEYFINVLEKAASESSKSKKSLLDDIANLNVSLRCASAK
jgi:hypothetical protein